MNDQKKTGSYYTPHKLVEFMIDYLKREEQDFTTVLEPSAGDGRFLSLLLPESGHIDAVELSVEKTREIREEYQQVNLAVYQKDFMEYVTCCKERYSLVVGNPPYISRKVMKEEQIETAKQLCKDSGLTESAMQNMWLAFVVGAQQVLRKTGTIFFVLPMEFLQVQYAEKLRRHLENHFNTIHVVSFEERVFADIEQDVCLVYLTNRPEAQNHILYRIYRSTDAREPVNVNIIRKNKPLKKWSNAILRDDEISMLKGMSQKYARIDTMGMIAPGIVTGGNKYFILTEEKVKELECGSFVLPILQKSSYINNDTIMIDSEVIKRIKEEGKPLYLLNLAKVSETLPKKLQQYLKKAGDELIGELKLKEHFKCANRTPWYGVPIVNKGQVVFFKRYGKVPRIYINRENIHTTDAGYHIQMKEEYEAESLVFCFFNSMTLAECEYNGRYYGGGVSELTPSEFKKLPIPYRKIAKNDIDKLDEKLKKKDSLENIIQFVNQKTICEDMFKEEVDKFEEIRVKLVRRRS